MSDVLFRFAVAADLHIGSSNDEGYATFRSLLEQMRVDAPDFILIPGDIGLGNIAVFEELLSEFDSGIPLHVVAGNDETLADRARLRSMFPDDFKGRDFYSFRHNNSLFIALCNAIPNDHIGHLSSEAIKGQDQAIWLAGELDKSRNVDHVFIFGHVPLHPEGREHDTGVRGLYLSINDQNYLRELLLKHKPTAMFFGHTHSKAEFHIGDTRVFVLPCLNPRFGGPTSEYLKVRVYRKRIDPQYISLSRGHEPPM